MIPCFNNSEDEAFRKTLWEKEKMLATSIFPFSHNLFLSYEKTNPNFWVTIILLSENAFTLHKFNVLLIAES